MSAPGPAGPRRLDVVIFGGGGAGLWLLDDLVRGGFRALLLEAAELGRGQTVASQGIIHGGLKYALSGWRTPAAQAVRDMPERWRASLAGQRPPVLTGTRLRAAYCHLWQTASLKSKLAMLGARVGLRVKPVTLRRNERPAVLSDCPGQVARLDEQVIEPASYVADLADQHRRHLWRIDAGEGLRFDLREAGEVQAVRVADPRLGLEAELRPRYVVLTAGAGNAALRRRVGLSADLMQRRPLRMVVLRGRLPTLSGHCVDGTATRVTVTSTRDTAGNVIWQVGGQLAENGVARTQGELISLARRELEAVLPRIDLGGLEWTTYLVDRAEVCTGGRRPHDIGIVREGNVITAWPTKLSLVPRLTRRIVHMLGRPAEHEPAEIPETEAWPRPEVALPPWETQPQWYSDA
ncbi:MAG: FAD-dependent oxidoreductase [Planctomycetota bacterium]|jgi:glycerol-3-phosphate dehydrogenase